MCKVTIIDSIMGSGKTSWAIQYMNDASPLERFIYITPFLDEIDRIQDAVKEHEFVAPNTDNEYGSKLDSLKALLSDNYDICATHALFKGADEEVRELLTETNYTLILDESFDAVEPMNGLKKGDVTRLLRSNDISIDPITKRVDWIGDEKDETKYRDVRILAQTGTLYCNRGTLFVWTFPPEIFKAFDRVFIMTYLFDGQPQRFYFDMFQIEYDKKAARKDDNGFYSLVDYEPGNEPRKALYDLIDVYQGKKNEFKLKSVKSVTLSSTNSMPLVKNDEFIRMANNNLRSFFLIDCEAKRDDVMYSAKKELLEKLGPTGFKEPNITKKERDAFYDDERNKHKKIPPKVKIPVNSRATNRYSNKRALAYLFNCYMNVNVKSFFLDNGFTIDENTEGLYSVGELLQWIFRSRIRNGEPIKLYLPSSRMRGLLEAWAKYEI